MQLQFEAEHFRHDPGQSRQHDDFGQVVQVRVGRQARYLERTLQLLETQTK